METTITLNEQQVDILTFELKLLLENESGAIDRTTVAVLQQIYNKLKEE